MNPIYQPFNGATIATDEHTYSADCKCSTCQKYGASNIRNALAATPRTVTYEAHQRGVALYRDLCQVLMIVVVMTTSLAVWGAVRYASSVTQNVRYVHEIGDLRDQLQAAQDNLSVIGK